MIKISKLEYWRIEDAIWQNKCGEYSYSADITGAVYYRGKFKMIICNSEGYFADESLIKFAHK